MVDVVRVLTFVQFVGDDDQQPTEDNAGQLVFNTEKNTASSPSLTSPGVSFSLGTEKRLPGPERRSQAADLQDVDSHVPSPNSYEFALHGLLALGSGNGSNAGLTFSPLEESRARLMTSAFDSVPMLDSQTVSAPQETSQELIGVTRVNKDWQSTSPIQVQIDSNTHGTSATAESPHAPTPGSESNSTKQALATVRANKRASTHQASNSKSSLSGWAATLEALPRDFTLELLTYYRYHIAPWVSDRQNFGLWDYS